MAAPDPTFAQAGLHIHRVTGTINGIPLDSLRLYSVAGPQSFSSAERRFFGSIANQTFDYTLSINYQGDKIEVKTTIARPKIPDFPEITVTYDLKSRWVLHTEPDILSHTRNVVAALTPSQTMVYLASDNPQEMDWHCVAHVIIHVGGICALFCTVPSPPCLLVFLICAGPSVVAALIGCRKKAGL